MIDQKLIKDGEICKELLNSDEFKEYQRMLQEIMDSERNNFCGLENTVTLNDAYYRGVLRNMKRIINLPAKKIKQGEMEKSRLNKGKETLTANSEA